MIVECLNLLLDAKRDGMSLYNGFLVRSDHDCFDMDYLRGQKNEEDEATD